MSAQNPLVYVVLIIEPHVVPLVTTFATRDAAVGACATHMAENLDLQHQPTRTERLAVHAWCRAAFIHRTTVVRRSVRYTITPTEVQP